MNSTVNSSQTPRHAVASPLDGVRSVPADGNMSTRSGPTAQRPGAARRTEPGRDQPTAQHVVPLEYHAEE
jgi:hypothetical protein